MSAEDSNATQILNMMQRSLQRYDRMIWEGHDTSVETRHSVFKSQLRNVKQDMIKIWKKMGTGVTDLSRLRDLIYSWMGKRLEVEEEMPQSPSNYRENARPRPTRRKEANSAKVLYSNSILKLPTHRPFYKTN